MKRIAAAFAAALLWACAGTADAPDNAAAFDDMQSGRSGDEVVVSGRVERTFAPRAGPYGVHEGFVILMKSGARSRDVLVADNISVGQPAPVRRGDDVTVKGVLELDPSGPVIHWTHHDPRFRHPSGYVEVGGKIYE